MITKISQVTPEVTFFLRNLGLSNYYIIKIFDLVGEAAIALTEDNPYWLLEEFPGMKFAKVDEIASAMGVSNTDMYRIQAGIRHGLAMHMSKGHTFVPAREFCTQIGGFLELPGENIEDVMEDMALSGDLQLTVVDGKEVLYFYGYYKTECSIVSKMVEMAEKPPKPLAADMDFVIAKAERDSKIKLSEQQREAVKNSLEHSVSVITGGPGTGKTTIINTLIKIMEAGGIEVAVAAPTGRAAKRISETTGKPAMTVHRLLEYYYDEEAQQMAFGRNSSNPLDYGAVIIDETSMMDLMLTGALCRALPDNCRLIFAGDADQLPSVGAGNVLGDLIGSGYIFTSRLTEIFRQSESSNIVMNSHRINRGEYPEFGGDFILVEADKQQEILEKITEIAAKYQLAEVQILTPTKKGILGSQNLNTYLQGVFNPPTLQAVSKITATTEQMISVLNKQTGVAVDVGTAFAPLGTEAGIETVRLAQDGTEPSAKQLAKSVPTSKDEIKFGSTIFRCGDRVMQIKNNYKLEYKKKDGSTGKGVFNGETGTVAAVHTEEKRLTVCYDDERWVDYPYIQLDEIELAYAVTVHKSQGSEFPVVIIPMSWFPPALATRNLIYTAITRGKEQVIIVGRGDYLNAMVDNKDMGKRNSGLKYRLQGIYEAI